MEYLGAILLFSVFGYIFWFATVGAGKSLGKRIKCPYCGNYGMNSSGPRYYLNGKHASDWKCPHCRKVFTKTEM